jgi:hypothetical protein
MSAANGYRLIGSMGELNKLVNRRVEVVGVIEGASGSGAMTGTPSGTGTTGNAPAGTPPTGGTPPYTPGGTAAGAPAGAGTPTGSTPSMSGTSASMQSNLPRLRVTSIREVPGTCSTQGQR